jgi:hypothetical protein
MSANSKSKKQSLENKKKALEPGRHRGVLPGANAFVRLIHCIAVDAMNR